VIVTLVVGYAAELVPNVDEHAATLPGSWFVTHPLGKPAGNTYTEVAFAPEVLAAGHSPAVLDTVVRRVASDLYGRAWAFTYPPEDYVDAVGRWHSRRRERVVVTYIDVIDDPTPRKDPRP
jgi:hypothetical protein